MTVLRTRLFEGRERERESVCGVNVMVERDLSALEIKCWLELLMRYGEYLPFGECGDDHLCWCLIMIQSTVDYFLLGLFDMPYISIACLIVLQSRKVQREDSLHPSLAP